MRSATFSYKENLMKSLSLDLETYSDLNLAKCGVYKYAESHLPLKSSFSGMQWMGDPCRSSIWPRENPSRKKSWMP